MLLTRIVHPVPLNIPVALSDGLLQLQVDGVPIMVAVCVLGVAVELGSAVQQAGSGQELSMSCLGPFETFKRGKVSNAFAFFA